MERIEEIIKVSAERDMNEADVRFCTYLTRYSKIFYHGLLIQFHVKSI